MDETRQSEYTLALRARDGDRKAVAELTARVRARLFALAYAELRHYEDANDAVAAGLLQICRNIGDVREPERVVGWMQSIVRNEARRLRRGGDAVVRPLLLTEIDTAVEDGEYSLLRLDIEIALGRIPHRQAEALRRFYFSALPIQTIAERMSASPGAVKMWLHRGRQSLRAEMEGYEPMTTTNKAKQTARAIMVSERNPTMAAKAAVLHSDLEPELQQRIAKALTTAGFAPHFMTPADLGEPGSTDPGPWDVLKGFGACVMVEPFGERSVYEYLLLLRASWETEHIPVAVVLESSRPDSFRALAFHALGVAGLASRDAAESLDCLFHWTGPGSPVLLSVILFADDEARRAGQERIGTEHLLLALLRDADIARWLRDDLRVSPDAIADSVRQRMERGGEYSKHPWRNLTDGAKAALHLAGVEATASGAAVTGKRHLLLGLVSEAAGPAAQALAEHGIMPEAVQAL